MQPIIKQTSVSDDEDDLESLRLAALQSLKRPVVTSTNIPMLNAPKKCNPKIFGGNKNTNKRHRGFPGSGRNSRNGAYNNRSRNSNLIAVQTIESEQCSSSLPHINSSKKSTTESTPKLVLPQDRYCNSNELVENKSTEAGSKFDRYNDWDNSESESDDEKITDEPQKVLVRSASLEALIKELDNEIHGKSNHTVEDKSTSKITTTTEVLPNELQPSINTKIPDQVIKSERKIRPKPKIENSIKKDELQETAIKSKPPILQTPKIPYISTVDSSVIQNNQNHLINQPVITLPYLNAPIATFQQLPYPNYNLPVSHTPQFDAQLPYNYSTMPQVVCPNEISAPAFPTNRFERPLSPLSLNTDILHTVTAPLSPRSAAFVLQNREIIERRKKSPRRSYSRSPSPRRTTPPRYKRSKSRSITPTRSRISPNHRLSPIRRISPTRRLSSDSRRHSPPNSQPSSKRSSPNSNRYRLSPPKWSSPTTYKSPKQSYNRATTKNCRVTEQETVTQKRSRSPSPSIENDNSNPLLEARKRKFETTGTIATEGIIRLKPKGNEDSETVTSMQSDGEPQTEEEFNENELLNGDDTYLDCNLKVDDLFSDEESDNENEGRFKSNRQNLSRVDSVVPFTQLLNGLNNTSKTEISSKVRQQLNKDRSRRDRINRYNRTDRNKNLNRYKDSGRSNYRSRSPRNRNKSDNEIIEKPSLKSLLSLKVEKPDWKKQPPLVSPIENKKIEIKIRNPSKYEVDNENYDNSIESKVQTALKEKKISPRKVEIANSQLGNDELSPKITFADNDNDMHNEDDDVSTHVNEGTGDLRAQLSRKRAERQNKLPAVADMQSRILQEALKGAVFIKQKKMKSKNKEKDEAVIDAKVPVHLRLGIPGSVDVFGDSKSQKKVSRKRSKMNKGIYDQV